MSKAGNRPDSLNPTDAPPTHPLSPETGNHVVFTVLLVLVFAQVPDVNAQALTSTEVRARLSKHGQRFQRHLTGRAALHTLITAVQAGDATAKLQLYALTKVCSHAC